MEYKIMLVEDDASIAKLIGSYIEKYGYKPIIVSDFDRVLDINMMGIIGEERSDRYLRILSFLFPPQACSEIWLSLMMKHLMK